MFPCPFPKYKVCVMFDWARVWTEQVIVWSAFIETTDQTIYNHIGW